MTGKDRLLRTHYEPGTEPGVLYTLLCFVPLPTLKKELVALTEKKKNSKSEKASNLPQAAQLVGDGEYL